MVPDAARLWFPLWGSLNLALDALGNRLAEIDEQYPHVSIAAMVFLAESRLGRLRTVQRMEEVDEVLTITELELLALVVKDNQQRARAGGGGGGAVRIDGHGKRAGEDSPEDPAKKK